MSTCLNNIKMCYWKDQLSWKNIIIGSIYISALTLFSYQVKDVCIKYFDERTTEALKIESHNALTIPTVAFCSVTGFKQSILKARGLDNDGLGVDEVLLYNDTQTPSLFESATYKLQRDFNISLDIQLGLGYTGGDVNVGQNIFTIANDSNAIDINVVVSEIATAIEGLCYTIKIDRFLNEDDAVLYNLQLSQDLSSTDMVSFRAILTDKPEDLAIILDDWHGLARLMIELKNGKMTTASLSQTINRHLEDKGECQHYPEDRSMSDCLLETLAKVGQTKIEQNCQNPCQVPVMKSLNNVDNLEQCRNYNDSACITDTLMDNYLKIFQACSPECVEVEYYAKIRRDRKYGDKRNAMLVLSFDTLKVQVYEEIYLFDFSSFIGNIGGSLGLFVGFSYLDFATKLTTKIIEFLSKKRLNKT